MQLRQVGTGEELGSSIAAMQVCGPRGPALPGQGRGSHIVGPPGKLGLLAHQLGLEVLLVGQDIARPLGDCLLLTDPDFLCYLESKS